MRRDERIAGAEITPAENAAPQRTYRGRTELDQGSAPAKTQHQRLRDVWKAARKKCLQPASRIAVPRLREAWIPQEGGIDEKEVETPRGVRCVRQIGRKVANGREICAEGLLCRSGRRSVFSSTPWLRKPTGSGLSMRIKSRAASQWWILRSAPSPSSAMRRGSYRSTTAASSAIRQKQNACICRICFVRKTALFTKPLVPERCGARSSTPITMIRNDSTIT